MSTRNTAPVWWKPDPAGYIRGAAWINGRRVRLLQHRWIMQQHLNRKLEAWEDVHHRNGNRSDNRIENLTVISRSAHGAHSSRNRRQKSGYRMELTPQERQRRSRLAKRLRLCHLGAAARWGNKRKMLECVEEGKMLAEQE